MTRTRKLVSMLVGGVLLAICSVLLAGDLDPTGPPTVGTMKTLDQVQPRKPIPGSLSPTGNFIISQPGSYYLTGERHCSGYGISIQCDNVTVDLMGYNLVGPGVGAGGYSGFYIVDQTNIEIRNGTIRDFGYAGINENNTNLKGKGHRIINIRVVGNGQSGIRIKGTSHLVKNCSAIDNGGSGFELPDSGNTVINCVAYKNGNFGITTGDAGIISDNNCYDNGMSGISGGDHCKITGNNTCSNDDNGIYLFNRNGGTVTGNTSNLNSETGIYVGDGCTVIGNSVYLNKFCGIWTGDGCSVMDNTVRENNQANSGPPDSYAGIRVSDGCLVKQNTLLGNKQYNVFVFGAFNVVEENLSVSCSGKGFYFHQAGNFYANNRAANNGTDYDGILPVGSGDGGGNASF
ncbi:MAG: right-handed parallel beta-helix repeat-containing protein [Sedimentisphaerales bacterium]|nr:right-handed parallel beta-helix repeat-containing protein [Sedimentisphaerales bacterium]